MSRYTVEKGQILKCVGITPTATIGQSVTVLAESGAGKLSFVGQDEYGKKAVYSKEYFKPQNPHHHNISMGGGYPEPEVIEIPGLMRPKFAKSAGEVSVERPRVAPHSPGITLPPDYEEVGPGVVDGDYTYKTIKYRN